MKYYEDPILGKGRAADISGGTGGSGTTYIGGFAIGISGDTISRLRYMPIESVTGNSVTLQAGHAYKAYATSTAITLNTETVPEGQFGLEGHIEIYVAGTGYVVTGTNVVLANALEPDSVNNCTLRFHDGVCIISVEDHVAGYIVVNGSTAGDGSLYYGITTSTNDYVAFDASLNGQTIPLAGATAEGEKHIVGNGYSETTITGAVNCGTSKFTVANLGLNNVQITGGVMTFGDAFIPSGSTVAVSGGGLAVEKVTGAGESSVIDLNHTQAFSAQGAWNNCVVSGVTITGGYKSGNGGIGIIQYSKQTYVNCVFSGNTATANGGAFRISTNSIVTFDGCTFVDNSAASYGGNSLSVAAHAVAPVIRNCKLLDTDTSVLVDLNTAVTFQGSNTLVGIVRYTGSGGGIVTITNGAIVDLTGNTNASPIAPGGGVIVDGGCTVINSAGASVNIAGGTYTKIHNDGTAE
jgi:hypothetical protein